MPLQPVRLLQPARIFKVFSKALYFDGVDDYVETPWVQNSVTQYTIVVWVNTTALYPGTLVQDRGSGAGLSITLAIPPSCGGHGGKCPGYPGSGYGFPGVGLDSNSMWIGVYATSSVNDGVWHCVVGVFNSVSGQSITPSNFSIYVDGNLANGNTNQIGSATSPVSGLGPTIIGYHQAWNVYYNGYISAVYIYTRALSSSEIQQIYNQPLNPPTNGLVLWYDWTSLDCSAGVWYDKSGNNNNGTIYGATCVDLDKSPVRLLSPVR